MRKYRNAVRSYSTDMYMKILVAAAAFGGDEFTANQLRKSVDALTKKKISQASLNNYFKRLVSTTEETLLVRKAKGVYKYSDRRMPSYVKIANGVLD